MKTFLYTILLVLISSLSSWADELTIVVTSIPANTPPASDIYIAGTINNWDPGNAAFKLTINEQGKYQIKLTGTGQITFKFTRGSWASVEGNVNGGFRPNRTFTFSTANVLEVSILSWEDTGGTTSTAAANVSIMHNAFEMPQLNRTRRIRIYLPPDYATSGKNYPVLYMHDGQNLFDVATSFAGEWQVDETLNQLHSQGKTVPIVVGIDNGANRIAEYTPWPNSQYGGGEGALYAAFIVETLKPYIDANYRTLPQREFTGVMGSSLGGLISFYIAHKYQHVFSKAGIFSPSFWFSESVNDFTTQTGKQNTVKYYMMAGTSESSTMIPLLEEMKNRLQVIGVVNEDIFLKQVPGGQHNEALWRDGFREAYEWLFAGITTESDDTGFLRNDCFMRHSDRHIYFSDGCYRDGESMALHIYNTAGQKVFQTVAANNGLITLPRNLSGVYLARLIASGRMFSQKLVIP